MKVDKFCISNDKQLEKRKKDTVYIIYIYNIYTYIHVQIKKLGHINHGRDCSAWYDCV